jgi:hypothetical protein
MSREGVHVAFKPCGCVAVVVSAAPDYAKRAAVTLGKCITGGCHVQTLTDEQFSANKFTFRCPHKPTEPQQEGLFA